MTDYSIDLLYAWQQLGCEPGASLAEVGAILQKRTRPPQAKNYVEFFMARALFGDITDNFADIRKAYRRKAFALHPDRNAKNPVAEDQLKTLNAAFGLVDKMHKQAKEFYKNNRKENFAKPAEEKNDEPPRKPQTETYAEDGPIRPAQKYMAASILRSIRQSRLGHLPRHVVIGSIAIERKNDLNVIYDVIMLPAAQFMRARSHLAAPAPSMHLNPGEFSPPYIPHHVKEFMVPSGAPYAEKTAQEHFKKEFGID
jgi:hypothetical protein